MDDSIRERITAATVLALDGADKPASLNVHRYRTRPISKDKLPAVVVYVRRETVDESAAQQVDRALDLVVQGRVEAKASESPDEALDFIYRWVVSALMADETLGGIAQHIEEVSTEWDAGETAEAIYGAFETVFRIHYITLRNDPESSS